MPDTQEYVSTVWNMFKEECDWQRHNESQRANLTALFLGIATALLAFLPKDRPLYCDDWYIPAFMIVVGFVGALAVWKYWERFEYHGTIRWHLEKALDDRIAQKPEDRIKEIRKNAIDEHDERPPKLFKDRLLKQHWIWVGVHVIVLIFGSVLLSQAVCNGPMPPAPPAAP